MSGFKILIVDDDSLFCEALTFSLVRKGFEVSSAPDGPTAIKMFSVRRFDLVILDTILPGLSGIEVLKALKSIRSDLPVVMVMTGFSEVSVEQVRSHGAGAIFCKPLDLNALVYAIKSLTDPNGDLSVGVASLLRGLRLDLNFRSRAQSVKVTPLYLTNKGAYASISRPFPQVYDTAQFNLLKKRESSGDVVSINGNGVVKWIFFLGKDQDTAEIGFEFNSISLIDQNKFDLLK